MITANSQSPITTGTSEHALNSEHALRDTSNTYNRSKSRLSSDLMKITVVIENLSL